MTEKKSGGRIEKENIWNQVKKTKKWKINTKGGNSLAHCRAYRNDNQIDLDNGTKDVSI